MTTRVYVDAEFYEDGKRIDLLSMAMVNDVGEHIYVINGEADWHAAAEGNPWLIEHVFPSLPVLNLHGRWHIDYTHELVQPHDEMRHNVAQFLEYCNRLADRRLGRPETMARENLSLWGYYSAYDHVALAQLWGRMIDLPSFVPMYTNDLRQEADRLGLGDLKHEVPMSEGEHDALADARWNARVHEWMRDAGLAPQF